MKIALLNSENIDLTLKILLNSFNLREKQKTHRHIVFLSKSRRFA